MKVKVYMQTLTESHVLYVNDAKRDYVLADTKETTYPADEFIFEVGTMVTNWPKELVEPNACDGLSYKICINNNGDEKTYLFQNKFPEDIYMLEDLIDSVLSEVKHV